MTHYEARIEKCRSRLESRCDADETARLRAQIAEIKANMATKSELETVAMAVMSLSGDVKTLKTDVNTLKTDVSALKTDVKNIDTRLKVVEEKIDNNLDNHDKRITRLEEKVLA